MTVAIAFVIATVVAIPAAAQQANRPQTQNQAHTTQQQTLSSNDATYAHQVITHHQMGLEMMQMAQQRGTSAVKSMAARMEKDQRKEIAELTAWTGGTHEQPTSTSGQTDHQKMMSATGAEFDKLFLDMMSQHHQQVIDLSKQALPQLKDGRIKAFARQTVTKQTREKTEMQRMLATKTKA